MASTPAPAPLGAINPWQSNAGRAFWQVAVDGNQITVCYGRVGSNGTTKIHTCDDNDAAAARAEKLITEKTSKGYVEQDAE